MLPGWPSAAPGPPGVSGENPAMTSFSSAAEKPWQAARCAGVQPMRLRWATAQPAMTRLATTSVWPESAA